MLCDVVYDDCGATKQFTLDLTSRAGNHAMAEVARVFCGLDCVASIEQRFVWLADMMMSDVTNFG